MTDEYEIHLYSTSNGKIPFRDWIETLKDKKGKQIILVRIQRLKHGLFGDAKALSNAKGLYELRVNFGPGYRIYYAFSGDEIILLLGGGDKSSQDSDIKKAVEHFTNYKREI